MIKYDVIYADPPWRYNFSKTNNRDIENHYPTMTTDDICALPIKNVSADDAVLYLWATAPKLTEALKVIDAWGFSYVTHGIWDKEIIGMGYWFRGQHELLMVGKRGNFSPPPPHQRISSIIRGKRGKHSKKPESIRDLIKEWYPKASRLELFARDENELFSKRSEGWDTWGNEAKNSIDFNLYY